MTETAKALYTFFSSFGIPAYLQDAVPDNAKMPYITYALIEPEPMVSALFNASVWYRGTSINDLVEKVDEIRSAIWRGLNIQTEGGALYLHMDTETPFCQIISDPNPETKRAYLTMIIHCNTL